MTNDTLDHNRRLLRRYFGEVWNHGALDVLDELLAADYLNHSPGGLTPPRGPAGLRPIVAAMRVAFPDLHYELEDEVVTEGAVVARLRMTGTHLGDFFGLPPTGRRFSVMQINIERIRDGRIAEHWRLTDDLAFRAQIGADDST